MSMLNKIREILVYLFMVEVDAGLDYIKDKVAKRTEEMIFHAECENVRSHELLVQQRN